MKRKFEARLTARGPGGAWTFLPIPFDVEAAFGSKARVAVRGTLNGVVFRNSLLPQGDGTHAMAVRKELKAAAKAQAGDLVEVTLEVDTAERVIKVPAELQQAIDAEPAAAKAFDSLSPSHRGEFAEWVASAKQPQTRQSRALKALPMILARKHVR